MEKTTAQIECLVQAQAFETMWAYYSQSDGQLYAKECREMANQFVASFTALADLDPRVLDPDEISLGGGTDVSNIVRHIKDWAEGASPQPYDTLFMSKAMTFAFMAGLKGLLLRELRIKTWPAMVFNSLELESSSRVVRWKGHLPRGVLFDDPDQMVREAFLTDSIAVVADIRRSQDLMTYAHSPKDFSDRMVTFVTRTRALIEKHSGFFDKFTGDGFVVYFNEAICAKAKTTHVEAFLGFLREELDFAKPLFQEWSNSIRKQPAIEIGLSIGADLGQIAFEDVKHHLVSVGDAIVWASRMASIGQSNEAIINNLLFRALEKTEGISFERREGKTKAGEAFVARALMFKEVSAESGG